ncbi:polyprenyl diphosphate synthase [Natronococcus sp. A-GB7]|uniref:polyprenyl diphosphate synthase n=1 Tax=Natronococcus sp. A-GB7 TaxID=3037649 RepID=UPI00241F3972|nr:polyprenyl diphosphate synthase [Natronococcus sp. A-GB7]MDG5821308.1 polyprenyl diphosphate synthase [Natronococcus sp. A-GB7]
MDGWIRKQATALYEELLSEEVSGAPSHVAVIQDGNRRYAREQGDDTHEGHRSGAKTTEQVLEWCQEIGVEELTLYAFSTENFERSDEENEPLFDLLCEKLYEFADAERVHDNEVRINVIGTVDRLPTRVQEAVTYATAQTEQYDDFVLNIALAYGGRSQLLEAARSVADDVDAGTLEPDEVDIHAVEERLYATPLRDVDLIIRTGGGERTSNFLPWHANGTEAAVFFCTPYWPEFSKTDFLRGIRTYEHRQQSWQRTRARRALTLLRSMSDQDLPEARSTVARFRDSLPVSEQPSEDTMELTDSNEGVPD